MNGSRKTMTELKNKHIVIASHVYATGPAHDLRDYLMKEKIQDLLFITHPIFYDTKLTGSGYIQYEKGIATKKQYHTLKKIPDVLAYILHVFYNVFWTIRTNKVWDLYVGTDNLNALSGLILQKLGRVKKTVYYVIDYNPDRFNNKILNTIYHLIEKTAAKYCDTTWNLSQAMIDARKKYQGFSGGNQLVTPIGIWFDRFERVPYEQVEKHTLVFMGHIIERQGVQHVVSAVPLIIKKIPDFHFLVMGGGDYLDELKKLAKNLNIENYVTFTGYVDRHEEIEEKLAKCAVAIAMYEKYYNGKLNLTHFADPGKIKSYLAAGLPILLTDVPPNARDIHEKECGMIIEPTPESIAQAVINLMENPEVLKKYRENAIAYAKSYNWETVFPKYLSQSL
jgi:glycosyltransferase involved in cell wall biosynthesis